MDEYIYLEDGSEHMILESIQLYNMTYLLCQEKQTTNFNIYKKTNIGFEEILDSNELEEVGKEFSNKIIDNEL